ncbi:hypothetical protein BJ165DRAFT_1398548 [Panaeolus papilionaceus]|nr:hypothetical protein BJ165DRAFT_1398548 [Panaeolus papilionaceus]
MTYICKDLLSSPPSFLLLLVYTDSQEHGSRWVILPPKLYNAQFMDVKYSKVTKIRPAKVACEGVLLIPLLDVIEFRGQHGAKGCVAVLEEWNDSNWKFACASIQESIQAFLRTSKLGSAYETVTPESRRGSSIAIGGGISSLPDSVIMRMEIEKYHVDSQSESAKCLILLIDRFETKNTGSQVAVAIPGP